MDEANGAESDSKGNKMKTVKITIGTAYSNKTTEVSAKIVTTTSGLRYAKISKAQIRAAGLRMGMISGDCAKVRPSCDCEFQDFCENMDGSFESQLA